LNIKTIHMKQLSIFAIAFLLLSTFSSCDKFSDKRFSTTIPIVFEIDKAEGAELVVDIEDEITSMINDELNAVKENIKSYELVSIKYKIWEYWGVEETTFNGSLGIGNKHSTSPGVTYAFNDVSVKAGSEDPAQVTMNFNSQSIDKIQQYFLDTDGLRLFLSGSTSHAPIHFKIAVEVNIDAIAEEKK
jgi:hypothetical protein